MEEYIALYNKIFNIKEEGDDNNIIEEDDLEDELAIPDEYSNNVIYSSTAKEAKREIHDFLNSSSQSGKDFYYLRDKFYNGDTITADFLTNFSKNKNLNYFTYRDNLGQTILHIAIDSMNYSSVESLFELGIAQELINTQDNFLMTPMHIAAINYDHEIFPVLMKLNPDTGMKDSEGKTYKEYLFENEDISEDLLKSLSN